MPLFGPPRVLTLMPVFPMLRLMPPGSAIVCRFAARRVLLRARVVTRRRTVFVRERRGAGLAGLRLREVDVAFRRGEDVRAAGFRRAGIRS